MRLPIFSLSACVAVLAAVVVPQIACAQDAGTAQDAARPVLRLWDGPAPLALGATDKDIPTLTVYQPPNPNGCAVVICPGGGYGALAVDHEGRAVGEWLNRFGVTGFVLRYRVSPNRHPVPLADVQRGLRTVRARAAEYGLDAHKIGVLGFSAGGHLASTAATHFAADAVPAADAIDRLSARPDFAVLVYPVISLVDASAHSGSRRNLLGENPDPELVRSLSNELQVTPQTPPVFLLHTGGDTGVPSENSVLFYLACRKAGVPAEMHLFEPGKHGFGLAPTDPVLSHWPDLCERWMRYHGWVGAADAPTK